MMKYTWKNVGVLDHSWEKNPPPAPSLREEIILEIMATLRVAIISKPLGMKIDFPTASGRLKGGQAPEAPSLKGREQVFTEFLGDKVAQKLQKMVPRP